MCSPWFLVEPVCAVGSGLQEAPVVWEADGRRGASGLQEAPVVWEADGRRGASLVTVASIVSARLLIAARTRRGCRRLLSALCRSLLLSSVVTT